MFDYLIKAYIYGLLEGFNPYAFVIGLYFVIYLSLVGRSFFNVLIHGFGFLISMAIFYGFVAAGLFDIIILRKEVVVVFQYVYLVVGCLYVVFGLLNLYDWSQLKKTPDASHMIIGIPSFLRVEGVSPGHHSKSLQHVNQVVIIFIGNFLGWFLVLSQTIWPVDIFIYRLFFIFVSQGLQRFTALFFGFYGFGYVSFLSIIWLGVIWLSQNKKWQLTNMRSVIFFKIIASSLYLAVGLGVIYIFFKQIS